MTMLRAVLLGISLLSASTAASASASEVEHWKCTTNGFASKWTIVEGRMFAEHGKGYLTVIYNSPSVVVAYDVLHAKDPFASWTYTIDKVKRKSITYDENVAANMHGISDPVDPQISIGSCEPF